MSFLGRLFSPRLVHYSEADPERFGTQRYHGSPEGADGGFSTRPYTFISDPPKSQVRALPPQKPARFWPMTGKAFGARICSYFQLQLCNSRDAFLQPHQATCDGLSTFLFPSSYSPHLNPNHLGSQLPN